MGRTQCITNIIASGEPEIMAPHIPFTQLKEVQQAMNPVTGITIVVAKLGKSNKAFNCTLSRGEVGLL